jgi:hypothetical protein
VNWDGRSIKRQRETQKLLIANLEGRVGHAPEGDSDGSYPLSHGKDGRIELARHQNDSGILIDGIKLDLTPNESSCDLLWITFPAPEMVKELASFVGRKSGEVLKGLG